MPSFILLSVTFWASAGLTKESELLAKIACLSPGYTFRMARDIRITGEILLPWAFLSDASLKELRKGFSSCRISHESEHLDTDVIRLGLLIVHWVVSRGLFFLALKNVPIFHLFLCKILLHIHVSHFWWNRSAFRLVFLCNVAFYEVSIIM